MSEIAVAPPPLTSSAELAALAAGLCQDAGIGLEVAPGGWFWDPVRRIIRVSAEGLQTKGPEYCAGIVAHEVGHFYISRYTSLPTVFPSIRAGRSLLNAIEDPRVDRWIVRRYPGADPWQSHAKVDEIQHRPESTWFLMFCLECAAEGDREWRPSRQVLPEPIKAALARTRDARRTYAHTCPPTDLDVATAPDLASRYRDEVWPLLTHQRWVPPRKEQRIQLSAVEALTVAEQAIFPVASELYLRDIRKVGSWLLNHPSNAGRGRRLLGEGQGAQVVGQAMAADLPDRMLPPWAEALAQQLVDGVVDQFVPAPMLIQIAPRRRSGRHRPWRDLPPLPPIWRPASDYDRAYAEVADQVDSLVQQLDEILRPRKRLRERAGYPYGRRVDLRRLMAFEADPRRYDEMWVRASIPDRREAAIGLLVDLSGSMRGAKARAALLGSVLVAETLARLQVPFRVDGFQDVLVPLHEFNEPLGPASRQRLSEMVQEVEGCRDGGNNNPRYNDDAPCLLEHAEKLMEYPATDRILIVVSDGLPEGRRSSSSDLHSAVAQLTGADSPLRLIALGLGPETEHVKSFYPEAVSNVPLPKFAETIGMLVENVLLQS